MARATGIACPEPGRKPALAPYGRLSVGTAMWLVGGMEAYRYVFLYITKPPLLPDVWGIISLYMRAVSPERLRDVHALVWTWLAAKPSMIFVSI